MGILDRNDIVRVLSMFALISPESETVNCVANYVKLGGDVDSYVESHVIKAKEGLSEWVNYKIATTPPPQKRKYTRRNLNPSLQDEPNNTVKIYCEGTCSNVGKPNAKAGFGVFCHITVDGEVFTRELMEALSPDEPQSNQRAELRALYTGMKLSDEIKQEFPTCEIEFVITSMYVHRSIYEWAEGWKQKNWRCVRHSDILSKIVDEIKFPCKLITKDSQLAGYTYARLSATKASVNTEEESS